MNALPAFLLALALSSADGPSHARGAPWPRHQIGAGAGADGIRLADMDGDGLPDTWEERHAIPESENDPDGDGSDNLSEYLAGTDPADADSSLGMYRVVPSGSNLSLHFPVMHAKTCRVWQATGALSNNAAWVCIATNGASSTFPLATNQVLAPLQNGGAFYRITATP